MPTNQSGWDAKKPARLEGFGTKQETTETPKESGERRTTAQLATVRARLESSGSPHDAEPVTQRRWWKYDLYKRFGRTDGGTM